MLADKGYDDAKIRNFLHGLEIKSDIPQRELPITWREKIMLAAKDQYKPKGQTSNPKRFVIERTNAWTKSFRRLRFRFDYTMLSFTALLNLAFVVICVRKLLP
ncbi:transposase [Candidatus Daviesbacteria bacterium]|nr:transposase [Candidatus Daviesbacteria bacterium]